MAISLTVLLAVVPASARVITGTPGNDVLTGTTVSTPARGCYVWT